MADKNNKSRNKDVDAAGIRLAPTPMNNNDMNVLPAVRQEYILAPRIVVNEPQDEDTKGASTAKDFQPKKEDISKKWKREKRFKNLIVGSIMFIFSFIVILPYILEAAGATLDWGVMMLPEKYSIIRNLINTFSISIENNWTGYVVGDAWIMSIKDIIVLVGFIFILINIIKSLYSMFASIKPVRYMFGAFMYFASIVIVFVASLVGAPEIGIDRIYFLRDFIYGYSTCEYFILIIFSAGYFIVSAICTLINSNKNGYLN